MARRRSLPKSAHSRTRTRQSQRQLLLQALEQRQLLAADEGPRLIGVSPNSGALLDPSGTSVLTVSPSEVVVRFDGGQQLDPTTLSGIQLVRSGNDGQIDGDDHSQDVIIQPGYVGFGDSQREVVLRFAEPLPDDSYELEIFGFDDVNRGIVGLRNLDGFLFQPSDAAANREVVPFQVELGAQIRAVVPQPVARNANGDLRQQRNQVVIYFNDDDLVRQLQLPAGRQTIRTSDVTSGFLPTVIDPQFYQLILTRQTVSGNDDVVVLPTEIEYDPALDRVILTFGEDQTGAAITDLAQVARTAGVPAGDATFRLRVGDDTQVSNANMPIRPRTENLLDGDTGSSFAAANLTTLGALSGVATLIQEQIQATERYALNYPGAFDEPGAREVWEQNHLSRSFGDLDDGVDARAISTLYYNFDKSTPYGVSDNGQQLFNAITPLQEQRAREIFEQLGDLWGVDFVETSSHSVDGIDGASLRVVVGDLVVFGTSGSTNQSGPGGVYGGVAQTLDDGLGGAHTFGRRIVLLDRGESWFNERGLPEATDTSRLSFYVHAMALIGNALGVGAASDQPPGTAMSGVTRNVTLGGEIDLLTSNPVEPALPGDADNVHGRYLYRPESRDIDVYRFSVGAGEVGTFSAEVFAERLHESASLLDARLALYDAQGTLLAANDDYYGEDSFLQMELGQGDYYLAVSASGNDQYDLNVNNSGAGGTSEGRYDVLVNFVPKANAELVDTSGTPIDGDGDGVAGGVFNYWFRATSDVGHTESDSGRRPATLLVDKSHTPAPGVPIGTEDNPYNNISTALAAARPGDIVRIVGNGGLDGQVSTLQDSFAYEIGRGGDQNAPLSDGLQMNVPAGVHVMIDAGAVFKMRNSRIGVGSSTTTVDRSGGSLQVLGTPFMSNGSGDPITDADGVPLDGSVIFTSYNDQSIGVDTNPLQTMPIRGEWGGIEYRNDVDRSQGRVDLEQQGIFLNYVAHGDFRYGGGQVDLESETKVVNPIHMTASRPAILENVIRLSADAAISADPESFEETNFNSPRYQQNDPFVSDFTRVGPDLRGNYLVDNSTNGLFVRVDTPPGQPTKQLTVAARFDDRDIVHFIGETLIVQGTPGGPRLDSQGPPASAVALAAANPTSGPSTLNPTGGPLTYTYRLTWVDAYGGESAPSGVTAPVTVAPGQQVRLSNLAPAPGDFVSRRIYRSQPGGQGPFTLVADIDRSSLTYTDRGGSTGATLAGPQAVAEPASGGETVPDTRLEYRFTLLDNQGNEYLVDEPAVVVDVVAGQQVRLSELPGNDVSAIPGVPTDRIVARRIYRSVAGADSFRRVGQTDLRSQEFVDNGSGTTFIPLAANLPQVQRTRLRSRPDARLAIDPGVVVKLEGTRIETGFGAQLIAEGVDGQPVVFTARADDRYGAGGTFDTNNDQNATTPQPGDWGGIYISPVGSVSIDYSLVTFGGGEVASGGTFVGFNALEIHQAEGRVTNSTFEHNASGLGGGQADQQRDGRGFNEPAAIFVRAAQPVIVNNIIRDNADPAVRTAAISINVNALNSDLVNDPGRQTGAINRFADIRGNQGPLIRQNLVGGNSINGLAIRGGTLTTESVWDDTDIVHVLANLRPDLQIGLNGVAGAETILIPDFHTFGGLRLESGSTQSLVVKFDEGAGITATGRPLDIEDRVGGTLQVIGSPGFPVVLTSLSDDLVGAGFTPGGLAQTDTNGDGPSQGSPGDWAGLVLDQFSNDRNVAIINERESPTANAQPNSVQNNSVPGNAEFLGQLAPDEKNGDDNLRLGFTVNGLINRPGDIDVYSFRGTAGSEVWLDIDRTSSSLDTIIELISSNGDILALSDNSYDESLGGTTLLANESLLPADRVHVLQKDAFGGYNTLDFSFRDDYTTNLRDAGMRIVLPGTAKATSTYFVRVRSNNQDPSSPQSRDIENQNETPTPIPFEGTLVTEGKTAGTYELQIRLRPTQEQDGSTVRFSEIRYATTGITTLGLPGHSPLLGEAAENLVGPDNNDTFATAANLGSLYATDRAALSIAAQFTTPGDVDWFQFRLEQDSIDPLVADSFTTPVVLDIDYADGLGRPNTSIWLFNAAGQLISFGTDSNIADDQPGPLSGVDQDDLSRGSAGPLDAWIGSLELPGGDYYVAVTNNSQVSELIEQYQQAGVTAAEAVVRLEPVSSIQRIASDHDFNDNGVPGSARRATAAPPITVAFDGNNNRIDYTLGDVVLFVTVDNGNNSLVRTVDPFTGRLETEVSQGPRVADIAMRPDGLLYGTGSPTGNPTNDDRFDDVLTLDTAGDGAAVVVGNTGIQTNEADPANGNAARAVTNTQAGNPPPRNGDGMEYGAITFVGTSGNNTSLGTSASGLAMLGVGERIEDPLNPNYEGSWLYRLDPTTGAGVSTPQNDRTANGVLAGAGTQIVERGFIDTLVDNRPNNTTAVLNTTSGANIVDGQTVQIGATTFEFDAGWITTVAPGAAAAMVDGDQIAIVDSLGVVRRLEMDFGQRLQVVDAALVGDGQTFTLTSSSGTVLTFEFDASVTPALSNPRHIRIPTAGSAAALAINIRNAVNALALPGMTAISQGTVVDFTGDSALNVAGIAGLSTVGSYGTAGGNTAVPVRMGMTSGQIAQAIADTVNGPTFTDRVAASAVGTTLSFAGAGSLAAKPSWLNSTLSSRVGGNFATSVTDGQTFVIRDSGGINRTVEIDLGTLLQVVDPALIVDGDTFAVTIGGTTTTFEFEDLAVVPPGGVTAGNVAVDFDSTNPFTAAQMAQQIANVATAAGVPAVVRSGSGTDIDFIGDTALIQASAGLSTSGAYGSAEPVSVAVNLSMTPAQVASAIAAAVNGAASFGGAITMTANGNVLQITGGEQILATPPWLSRPGVASSAYPIAFSSTDSALTIAEAMVGVMQSRGFPVSHIDNVVYITGSTSFSVNGSTAPFGQATLPAGGSITGIAPIEIGNQVRLFAVSEMGDLFEITRNAAGQSFSLSTTGNRSDYITTIYDASGARVTFAGLTAGPRNANGGSLAQTLFGVTDDGEVYAFDTAGRPAGVFMNGRRSVDTGQSGVTGLAFSNLDVNLWHVTNTRGGDAGHGIQPSPDHNDWRTPPEPAGSNNSLYFGFENPRSSGSDIQTGQWGGIYDIGDTSIVGSYAGNYLTYNFPGGAEGTMESNPLDLSGYAVEDLPTLYFSYYLQTENANSDLNDSASAAAGNMQDAFRVYAAGEDGHWQLLATNNSESDRLNGLHDEREDEFDEHSAGGTKKVQELFDVGDGGAPDAWRQVRIPLEDFAGQKNVRIRFDFSTAASSAIGDPWTGGEELRAVAGASIQSGQLLRLQSAAGNTVTTFEFDMGLDLQIPTGAHLDAGDQFWVDGQQYTFVNAITGANQILFAPTDSAADLTQRVAGLLQINGHSVEIHPEQLNRLNVLDAQNGFVAAGLPSNFLLSQPGVASGNIPIVVHVGMDTAEVAAAVQQAFASALNEAGSQTNTDTYQVRNGYMLSLYGHSVLDPGPLGLTRHAGALQPFNFANPQVNGFPSRLPGQEFGRFSNPSRNNPGSLRGRNNAFEGVYVDDIIIGFRERGEMVIGAGATTAFVANAEYEPRLLSGQVDETERGAYQLEIRRGAGYAFDDTNGGVQDSNPFDTFDTNARLTDSVALVAPVAALLRDGQTFTVSDGTDVVTFEFDDTTLPAGNPHVGVVSGNVVVPFSPTMTAPQVAHAMRDAINSSAAQTRLDVLASLSDGSTSAVTSTGQPSTSNLVYLHGLATADTFGSLDFGDLNNNGDGGGIRWFDNDDIVRFDRNFFPVAYLGDQNVFRDQGQVLLQGNVVTDALQFGISVLPGARDRQDLAPLSGVLPHPGAPRQTLEINHQQLAPGVTVFNNVLNQNGQGGIEIRGETDAARAAMAGAVPFARIVNNTVYGDGTGTGILVADNASPTLLNNIIANMNTGISVDASSDTTVVGTTLFQGNTTNSNFLGGNLGAFPITLGSGAPLFVDPSSGNFYLADQSEAIDSSLAAFGDRTYFITIKQPLGIGESPIIAPQRDITGQLRVDDPNVNTPSGIGQNVFVDRGAIDRSDFIGPTAALLRPQDNDLDGNDLDGSASFVRVGEGTLDYFELVLVETNGTGPDVQTVTSDAVTITEDGRLLEEGVDYTFGFSATNRTIRLTPLSAIWRPDAAYEITLNNRDRIVLESPQATDIVDGDQFTITDTTGTTATFEYDTGFLIQLPQTLLIDIPAGQGSGGGFGDGERFSITAPGGTVVTFEIATVDRGTGANTRVLLNPGDTAEEVREAIFAALVAQSATLDLAPRRVGDTQIQIGSKAGHAVNPLTSPMTVSGVAAGIADGDSLSYTTATDTLLIEFDNDGTAVNASADVLLAFSRTDTPDELAARIADALINSNLGLVGIRALEQGRVALGGTPSHQLVIDSATITQLGTPGVAGPLLLNFPAGLIAEDYEAKTVVLNIQGTVTTFEFSLDSNKLPGTELILLQPGQDAAAVAARFTQAVDAVLPNLTPTVVNGNEVTLGEPVGSSIDLSNSPITSTGVGGGATAVSLLPSSTFSRDIVAGQLLAAIVASPLQSAVFAPGGGDLYLDNTLSVGGASWRNLTGIKDLAGNNLQPNRINAETQFTILMPGVELDFGDAPHSFELNIDGAFNPARHTLSGQGQPRLGTAVDAESANPHPSTDDLSPVITASSAAPTFTVTGGGSSAAITVGPDDAGFAPLAGETVTITVGTRSWTFELSTDGNVTTAAAIPVHFTPADDAPAVAASLAEAVERVTGSPVVVSLETARQNELRLTLVDDEEGVGIGSFQSANSPAAVDGLFLDPTGGFLGFLNPSDPIGSALSVTVTGSGLLDAWVDFNRDGDWNDPGEQILANEAVLPGENRLLVKTPTTAPDGLTWARFRLSTTGNQLPRGVAIGGEVEDYQVRVASVVLPEPIDDAYATDEDNVLSVTDSSQGVLLRAGQPDVLHGLLNPAVDVLGDVTFGALTLNADGTFQYVPDEDFFGTDVFTYQIVGEQRVDPTDPNSPLLPIRSSKVGTVTITVHPVNDAPSAPDKSFQTIEPSDTSGSTGVTITASQLLTGALPQDDANLRIAPFDEKEQSLKVIQISVFDAAGGNVDVVPLSGVTPTDGQYTVDTFVAGARSGSISVTVAAGAVTQVVYQPADDYNTDNPRVGVMRSLDSFRFTVADDGKTTLPGGNAADPQPAPKTVTATATIQVFPQNDLPVGQDDVIPGTTWTGAAPTEDTALLIPRSFLLSNDAVGPAGAQDELGGVGGNDGTVFLADDPALPGLPAAFTAFPLTTAQGGTVALDAAGNLIYSPAADYFGPDSFVYFVGDQGINEDVSGTRTATPKYSPVTVSLTVAPVNDVPLAAEHDFATTEDLTLTITAAQLLADAVAHGDPQLPTAPWDETNQQLRVISLDVGGTSVTAANAASGQRFFTPHGEVTATFDVDGSLVELQYIPNTDFNVDNPLDGGGLRTIEQFRYTIADDGVAVLPQGGTASSAAETSTATVRITVTPQNDVPVTQNDLAQAGSAAWDQYFVDAGLPIPVPTEDTALVIPAAFLLQNDAVARVTAADELLGTGGNDGALALQSQTITTSLGGTVTFDANGDLVYTPPADLFGLDTFVYTVVDQGINEAVDGTRSAAPLTATGTVTISVTPVNDLPSAPNRQYTLVESGDLGQNIVFTFTADDLLSGADPATDDDAVPGVFADTVGAPYDESDQTLRVVQFTTSEGTAEVTDLPGGTGTVVLATGAGGILTLNFVAGGFVDGSYVPAADYNERTPFAATDLFTYLISDDGHTTSPDDGSVIFLPEERAATAATVTLTVTETNDPPEFQYDAVVEILERDDSQPNTIGNFVRNVLPGPATALDELARQNVTFSVPTSLASDPDGIMLQDPDVTATGALVIYPAPDAVGTATYVIRATDDDPANPRSTDVTVTIHVRPVNDPPVANPNAEFPTIVVDEDLLGSNPSGGPLMIPVDPSQISELLAAYLAGPPNELDATLGGNQSMQVVNTSVPATTAKGGTVQVVTDPTTGVVTHLLYTPVANYNDTIDGTDSFDIILRDDGRSWNLDSTQGPLGLYDDFLTISAGIKISLTPRNDAPTFTAADTVEVLERDDLGSYVVPWATNILVGPSNPGSTPDTSASDELGSQTSFFEIVPLGDPALHAALLSGPLSITAGGQMEFTPRADAVGTLLYAVTLVDSGVHNPSNFEFGRSATQTLTLTLRPVNDAPQASGPVTAQTLEDTAVVFAADPDDPANSPLLQVISVGPANELDASDGGNQKPTIIAFDSVTANGGTVAPIFDPSGTVIIGLRYQPGTDYNDLVNGVDTFTYTVSDHGISYQEAGDANDGVVGGSQDDFKTVQNTVTISLTPVNDPPLFAGAGSVTVLEDAGQGVPGVDPADIGLSVIPAWANAIFAGRSTAQDERRPTTGQQVQFVITPVDPAAAAAVFSSLPTASSGGTLSFRTHANAVGSVTFTVQLFDDGNADPAQPGDDNDSDVRTFTISVTPVNDPPTFVPGADVTVAEDSGAYSSATPWATAILPGPPDEVATGQTVSFQVTTPAASQSLFTVLPSIDGSGFLTFQLRPDANGAAVVTVRPIDSLGLAGQSHQLTLTVTPRDDTPVAGNDFFDTNEDVQLQMLRQQLLANDVDVDLPADTLTLTAVPAFSALGAAVSINAAGNVVYDATTSTVLQQMTPDQSATDTFTYQLRDASGRVSNVATVTLNVAGRNDAPSVQADQAPVNLSGPTVIRPLDNDSDIDGTINPATLEITVQPRFGAVAIASDGTLTYSPFGSFQGLDTLSYAVADNLGQKSKQAVITISANVPPSFTAGPAITVNEDSGAYASASPWATAIVPGPASEIAEGQTVRFEVSVPPQAQALFSSQPTLSDDGFLTFAVADDASGQAAVTITPFDSAGAFGQPRTLTITVTPSNDLPVASGEQFDTTEDAVLQLTAQQLLANDTDADAGDTLTITGLPTLSQRGAPLSVDASGNISYDPTGSAALQSLVAGQTQSDWFTYRVEDAAGGLSNIVTVMLTVDGRNDAPTAVDDSALTYRGEAIDINVVENDTDADGNLDQDSVSITRQPQHGSLTVLPGGVVRYQPDAGFAGEDSFGYTVADGTGLISPEGNVVVRVPGSRLQNPAIGLAADVNGSGTIEALDALVIINYLNSGRPTTVTDSSAGPYWYDVDGNGVIQPLDALRVINAINRQARNQQSGGEGEAATVALAAPPVTLTSPTLDQPAAAPVETATLSADASSAPKAWDALDASQQSSLDKVLDQLASQRSSDDSDAATATVDRVWNDFGNWQ